MSSQPRSLDTFDVLYTLRDDIYRIFSKSSTEINNAFSGGIHAAGKAGYPSEGEELRQLGQLLLNRFDDVQKIFDKKFTEIITALDDFRKPLFSLAGNKSVWSREFVREEREKIRDLALILAKEHGFEREFLQAGVLESPFSWVFDIGEKTGRRAIIRIASDTDGHLLSETQQLVRVSDMLNERARADKRFGHGIALDLAKPIQEGGYVATIGTWLSDKSDYGDLGRPTAILHEVGSSPEIIEQAQPADFLASTRETLEFLEHLDRQGMTLVIGNASFPMNSIPEFRDRYEKAQADLDAAYTLSRERGNICVIHGDNLPKNLRFDDQGNLIFFDFGRPDKGAAILSGIPEWDLGRAVQWDTHYPGREAALERILYEYEKVRKLDPEVMELTKKPIQEQYSWIQISLALAQQRRGISYEKGFREGIFRLENPTSSWTLEDKMRKAAKAQAGEEKWPRVGEWLSSAA